MFLGTPVVDWLGDKLSALGDAQKTGNQELLQQALAPVLGAMMVLLYFGEIFYFSLWEFLTGGRSPGKYLVGLRVVSFDGRPLSIRAVGVRNLMRVADLLPAGYTVGLCALVISKRTQRLGDQVAGTLVIRTERVQLEPELEIPVDVPPLALSRAQLARLTHRELHLARSTLRRLGESEKGRGPLLNQVALSLVKALGLEPSDHPNAKLFLQQLIRTAPSRTAPN